MPDTGFAVRCPHCLEWRTYKQHPRKVALESERELREILDSLHRDPDRYTHPKLLKCDRPLSVCPAPTIAFVCRTESEALKFVQRVPAWSLKRDFRLYRSDKRTRWDQFVGILFRTLPVPRQKHIELENLLDRQILSRAIIGYSDEVRGPFTVYAAEVFEQSGATEIVWAPIEGAIAKEPLIPRHFNVFCRLCRDVILRGLLAVFLAKGKPTPETCPHPRKFGRREDNTCAGRDAACLKEDWNHCPAFLEVRRKKCPCYRSDLPTIKEVRRRWANGLSVDKPLIRSCWAGLKEIAFPIVVHDHFVGVAMTGQLVPGRSALKPIEKVMLRFRNASDEERKKVGRAWGILSGSLIPHAADRDEKFTADFRINKEELERRIGVVSEGVRRIADVAKAHYHRIRGRSETVFKQEILGRIENVRNYDTFFDGPVGAVLHRMREFWAFKAAYLLVIPPGSNDLYALARSTGGKPQCFGYPGEHFAHIKPAYTLRRPLPMLLDKKDPVRTCSAPARAFAHILNLVTKKPQWRIPDERCIFVILVPVVDHVFAFLFAARNKKEISPLGEPPPRGLSDLAQEAIFETCTEVVHRVGNLWFHQASERAWRDFSADAAHRIGNRISSVSNLLEVLSEKSPKTPEFERIWHESAETMRRRLASASEVLTQQAKLTGRAPLDRQWTDAKTLIRRAVLGALPIGAKPRIAVSPDARMLYVEADLMDQALSELATNAARHADDAVQVSIRVGPRPQQVRWDLGTPVATGGVQITFEDNGPGLPKSLRQHLVNPNGWAVAARKGGLAAVRRIIDAHGGTIRLKDTRKGACFVINIPQSEDTP